MLKKKAPPPGASAPLVTRRLLPAGSVTTVWAPFPRANIVGVHRLYRGGKAPVPTEMVFVDIPFVRPIAVVFHPVPLHREEKTDATPGQGRRFLCVGAGEIIGVADLRPPHGGHRDFRRSIQKIWPPPLRYHRLPVGCGIAGREIRASRLCHSWIFLSLAGSFWAFLVDGFIHSRAHRWMARANPGCFC